MKTDGERRGVWPSAVLALSVLPTLKLPVSDVNGKARRQADRRRAGSRNLPEVLDWARASACSSTALTTAFMLPRAPPPPLKAAATAAT